MSLIKSFTRQRAASRAFTDYIEPIIPMRLAGNTTTAAATANTVYLHRFRVDTPFTIVSAKLLIGATSAGNLAIGIYTKSGTTYTKVAGTADTAAGTASAVQTINFTASYTLYPGQDYYLAFGCTDATLTFLRLATGNVVTAIGETVMGKTSVYSSGLPSSISSPVATSVVPYIALSSV